MNIKLDYAYQGDELKYISEDLNRNKTYSCPFCKEEVIFRKGEEREHHFSHKPGSNCSANSETILHFNAKNYLADECHGPNGYYITLNFPLEQYFPGVYEQLSLLGLYKDFSVNLHEILVSLRALKGAKVEERIGPYIADVYCPTGIGNGLAIEVCVTHEIEEEKRSFYSSNGISYLELIPRKGENKRYEFEVKSSSIDLFFNSYREKVEKYQKEHLYSKYYPELVAAAREPLMEKEEVIYKQKAVRKVINDINNIRIDDYIKEEVFKKSTTIRAQAFNSTTRNSEPLKNVQYVTSRNGSKYLMGNDKKYFISNEQNLLYDILNKIISAQVEVEALVGGWANSKKNSIIGFNLKLPNPSVTSDLYKYIIEQFLTDLIMKFDNKIKKLSNQ
jgi:hypothetical protein